MPVAAGSVRFFNGAVMGIVYFFVRGTLAQSRNVFSRRWIRCSGESHHAIRTGSKHCLTKDMSMVLESGSQGIQLLYKSSDFVKKATFNPKVDYFAPKA